MTKNLWSLPVVLLMMFVINCSKGPDSYYPLKEGRSWEYQVTTGAMFGSTGTQKLVITNFALRDLGGKKVTPRKIDIGGQTSFYFIAEDASGILEYASQPSGTVEPEIKASPTYILKNPIQAGTTWEDKTKTIFGKVPYTQKNKIESIDETVTVPAGTFKGCIKLRATGSVQKNTGIFGIAKITIEQYEWFAPDIGMIKSSVKESSNHMMVGSGEINIQLESFKK